MNFDRVIGRDDVVRRHREERVGEHEQRGRALAVAQLDDRPEKATDDTNAGRGRVAWAHGYTAGGAVYLSSRHEPVQLLRLSDLLENGAHHRAPS